MLSAVDKPQLCHICASDNEDRCIVCDSVCGSSKFPGKFCKTCTARKNFCARCGDPLKGAKKEGFLCSDCGLGKASDNCCKMLF